MKLCDIIKQFQGDGSNLAIVLNLERANLISEEKY
jgi:hypothetical protein